MDEKGKTHTDAKDGLMENSNENSEGLCSNVLQNESEKSEHVHLLPTEKKEKFSFAPASNCGPTILSISEKSSPDRNARLPSPDYESPLDLTLNTRANKVLLYENASLKGFQEMVEPKCIAERDILGACKTPSFVPGSNSDEKKTGLKFSNLMHAKGKKGCGVSMEERKCLSLNRDKEKFLYSLLPATENASSNNTNISRASSFLINSDVLTNEKPNNEEPNNEMIESLGNPKNSNIPTEIPSLDQINSEEMAVNEDEPICSNKKDTIAGPSRTCSSKNNYACDICPKQFKKKSYMNDHYRTHTGEKPFVCDLCGIAFTRKYNLTLHIRTHTGDKPFECDVCGKVFAQKSSLTVHIRTHTGDKPFMCNVCGKAFAHKNTLTGHIETHTEEKPHKCPVCDKVFAILSNCYRHQRRVHKSVHSAYLKNNS